MHIGQIDVTLEMYLFVIFCLPSNLVHACVRLCSDKVKAEVFSSDP